MVRNIVIEKNKFNRKLKHVTHPKETQAVTTKSQKETQGVMEKKS